MEKVGLLVNGWLNQGAKNLRPLIVVAILLMAIFSEAQTRWKNVDHHYQPLPKGMHVFFTTDSLDGKPNRAFYVSVPLQEVSIGFSTDTTLGRRITPSQYFDRNQQPVVVVNTTFFSPTSRNLNVVINEGHMLSMNVPSVYDKTDSSYHYLTRSALGINSLRQASVAWVFTDTSRHQVLEFSAPVTAHGKNPWPSPPQLVCDGCNVKLWSMKTAVGGGPTLISKGAVRITNDHERMFAGARISEKHPRTAMGYTEEGHLIIMVIEGRFPGIAEGATLLQEAILLKELGCFGALNLDGGGSSCLLINGKETIKPSDVTGQRPVPSVFLIKVNR